ncbi:c-type heme family protein [Salidesulfovibrio onnuriiensis]|uniref:c-type heme family protein n=1 Tax=Salidesulfovibrio onnuriiensis TaxID=2583823 RepID=UPI0011C71C96|nr:DUF3365 domain-containing protein [Salidesulfovibrio onnuriiensis]
MAKFRPQTLQSRFLLGLGAIVLLGGVFFSASMYFHLKSLLHTQVVDKAELMLSQVDSVQQYVRKVLRPKMFRTIPKDQFIIEAMSSSYISRKIMDRVGQYEGQGEGVAQFLYRRVSENARNPKFEINAMEREIMDRFRADPLMAEWEGYQKIDGKEYFLTARPVIFYDKCMHCHGSPADAPQVLIERYGDSRGFGRTMDSIGGIDLVGLPVDSAVSQIQEATVGYIGVYAGGMFIFFAIVQVFYNRLVTHNLHRLTRVFRDRFQDQEDMKVLERVEEMDEIEEIVQGMEELGDHLVSARTQLRDYAANLEMMVDQRTRELSKEVSERQADVALFVLLLDQLNQSRSRQEMWQSSLPIIARRFGASGAGFTCMLATQNFYSWPEPGVRPGLPETWQDILTGGEALFEPGRAVIPVGANDSAFEGLLTIFWEDRLELKDQDRDVLVALGQQLGIAMENLGALDNLIRQKGLLQSVVEGISDPLLYMDGRCSVVLANHAARALGRALTTEAASDEGGAEALMPSLFGDGENGADCPLRGAMERGVPESREVRTRDNRHFSVSLYPVGGEEKRLVVYIREVTNEKSMLARMRQSEKLATVGQLAAGLAHEMNNPLGVIKCYGELLRNAVDTDNAREDVEVIMRHATQAQNVLQDLLNFARPGKGDAEEIDLAQTVRKSARVFLVQAEKRGVRVDVDIEPEFPGLTVNGQAMEQILANLFNNALDAVREGAGKITLKVFSDPVAAEAVLMVADNGGGIPADVMDRIFDPFFSTKEVGKGTGLGLAVVYGLVRDLGGRIDVVSDQGAQFFLHFPFKRGE